MGRSGKLKSRCISFMCNPDTSVKCFLIIVLLVILFYSNYIRSPFAADTYSWYFRTCGENAVWMISNGRFVSAVIVLFMNWARHRVLAYLIEILCISAAFLISLRALTVGFRRNVWACLLALCPLFLNPLYCEWFPYHESISMTFGLVFSSLSAYWLIDALNGRFSKKIAISFLFLVLSSGCYQPVTEHFVAISLMELIGVLVYIEDDKFQIRRGVTGICLIMAQFVLVGLFQVVFTKCMCGLLGETQRISHFSVRGIKFLFSIILPGLVATGQGTSPKFFLLVISILLFLIFAIVSLRRKNELIVSMVVVAICVIHIVLFSPFFLMEPEMMWVTCRTLTCFYAIPGIIYAGTIFLINRNNESEVFSKAISSLLLVFLLAVLLRSTITFSTGQLEVQYTDRYLAGVLCEQIKEYEEENGITVSRLAFPYDEDGLNISYPNIARTYDINVSGFRQTWSQTQLMNFVSGRVFSLYVLNDDVYKKYEKVKRDCENKQQIDIYFDGDVAYIPIRYDW